MWHSPTLRRTLLEVSFRANPAGEVEDPVFRSCRPNFVILSGATNGSAVEGPAFCQHHHNPYPWVSGHLHRPHTLPHQILVSTKTYNQKEMPFSAVNKVA